MQTVPAFHPRAAVRVLRGMRRSRRPSWTLIVVVAVVLCLRVAGPARAAQATGNQERRTLIVATKSSPPFAFRNPDGDWTGISIELWEQLAAELDLEYEFREMPLSEMIDGLASGDIDVAVAAISVTAERLERVEFCHPHFTTGLGIAVSSKRSAGGISLLRRVMSRRLWITIGCTVMIVVICGVLFWIVERKKNESVFGRGRRQGIGIGVWWSLIMLLGHKGVIPVSSTGRIVAAFSMIGSIMLLSILTGVIASALTVRQIGSPIDEASDLRNVRVVTVASSTSDDYLRQRRIRANRQPDLAAAMEVVVQDRADAAVYDQAMLQYVVNDRYSATLTVLPVSFNTQEYAIGLPPQSDLRRPLNGALLRFRAGDKWDEIVFRYLGQ